MHHEIDRTPEPQRRPVMDLHDGPPTPSRHEARSGLDATPRPTPRHDGGGPQRVDERPPRPRPAHGHAPRAPDRHSGAVAPPADGGRTAAARRLHGRRHGSGAPPRSAAPTGPGRDRPDHGPSRGRRPHEPRRSRARAAPRSGPVTARRAERPPNRRVQLRRRHPRPHGTRDVANTARLEAAGWRVVRVWEHEPLEVAVDAVEKVLDDVSVRVGPEPRGRGPRRGPSPPRRGS